MLKITSSLFIDEDELRFEFIRAAGPGGQNVNKVATAVQLRFDIKASRSLNEEQKQRLIRTAGRRVNADGVLVIEARRHRTQDANREDALERFAGLVRKSLEHRKPRKRTGPTRASREKRLQTKKKRGELKRGRRNKTDE